ncbi:hypothetical protein ATE84_3637 [Aquimarina sp. MAR_2010_214]|uniref:DUF3885 domain-containing protein n=1 Tax=Aquimarina sp. MAR_2010_214 TaxID=1250026 RepID=UPI000C710334|nr:hypothetical protein [Aquimarina sp. MAR_2010_214]PKV51550.1 hypothetical protein ATE84_3637 [Aquimarina sp. MAR_2010_214]
MNREQFNKYWDSNYPESNPIGHELKSVYPNRWLRIHSLPESKRYAESEDEYQIILDRQNKLITELVGENTEIIITSGQYEIELTNEISTELSDYGEFEKCRTIELHKIYPEEYKEGFFYDVYFKPDIWTMNSQNKLLKNIADDELRAMFICPKENCIVASYDGGMDIIIDSQEKRDRLKAKYSEWISEREDGM